MDEKRLLVDLVAIAKNTLGQKMEGENIDMTLRRVCAEFYPPKYIGYIGYGRSNSTAYNVYDTICEMARDENGKLDEERLEEFLRKISVEEIPVPGMFEDTADEYGKESDSGQMADSAASPGYAKSENSSGPKESTPAPQLYRCRFCGHTSSSPFSVCVQCGKEKHQSFLQRFFNL